MREKVKKKLNVKGSKIPMNKRIETSRLRKKKNLEKNFSVTSIII